MIDKKQLLGRCLQLLMVKDYPIPSVRGLISESTLDLDGSMICVGPWGKDNPLNKIASSVTLPYHIYVRDIVGVMEIESAEIPSGEAKQSKTTTDGPKINRATGD